jgi:hypothetical protein
MRSIYQYLRMLLLLSAADLREFKKFLHSDYCCTNVAARRLFDFLYAGNHLPNPNVLKYLAQNERTQLQNSPFLDKELLFFKAFGKESNGKIGKLDTLMTHSKDLLEKFLIFESLKHDSYTQNLYLLRMLKNKEGFDIFFEQKMEEVRRSMEKTQVISIRQLLFRFWYNEIDYAYKITHDKDDTETTNSFMELLTSFNKYIGAIYLKFSAEVINRAEIFTEEQKVREYHPLFLLPHVLWLIGRRESFLSVPVISLYYNLIKSLLSPHKIDKVKEAKGSSKEIMRLENKEDGYYRHLEEELTKEIIQAPLKIENSEVEANTLKVDLLNLNNATSNYLIRRKIYRNHEPFNIPDEIFNLKHLAVKHKLSSVTPNSYLDFVKTSLKLILKCSSDGDLVKANQTQIILDTYTNENWESMSEIEKRELSPFIEGLKIVYGNSSMENIKRTISKLDNSTQKSLISELSRRVLLLQLHYKADNFIQIGNDVARFRNFLIMHKMLLPKRVNTHRLFFNLLNQLSRLKQQKMLGQNINDKRNQAINAINASTLVPIEHEWLISELNAL